MKRTLVATVLLALTACASEKAVVKKAPVETKKELDLWQVLRHKKAGEERLTYEDKWYAYNLKLTYITKRGFENISSIGGLCPVDKAVYTVYDKESRIYVKEETIEQAQSCARCHRR